MATGSVHGGFDQASLLLSDHNRVKSAPANVHCIATKLAQGITNTLEQVCMPFNEIFCSVVAASLLIAYHGQYHVTCYRHTFGFSPQQGGQHHGYPTFHIQRSPAPDVAICRSPREWWVLPLLVFGGDNVNMSMQQQRWCMPLPCQACDQVGTHRITRKNGGLNSGLGQQVVNVTDTFRLFARWIGRVETDELL